MEETWAHAGYTKMNEPSWDDLRIFAAVAAHGSFSRAAAALGTSQPTVSRRIEALEQTLGGQVLERTSGGCVLTALGTAILPRTEQMRGAADEITRLAVNTGRDLAGKVRIACGELPGRLLARHVDRIVDGAEGLELEIVVGMAAVNLFSGEAELALRSVRPDSDQLYARKIWSAKMGIYASPGYLAVNPDAAGERLYSACRWIGLSEHKAELPTSRWLAARLPTGRPALRFATSGLILEACASGHGLALLPHFIGEPDPRLVRVGPYLDDFQMQMLMVMHASVRKLPRVRWVADRLVALFGLPDRELLR